MKKRATKKSLETFTINALQYVFNYNMFNNNTYLVEFNLETRKLHIDLFVPENNEHYFCIWSKNSNPSILFSENNDVNNKFSEIINLIFDTYNGINEILFSYNK